MEIYIIKKYQIISVDSSYRCDVQYTSIYSYIINYKYIISEQYLLYFQKYILSQIQSLSQIQQISYFYKCTKHNIVTIESKFKEDLNCEHTAPQSFFNKELPMRSDLHHLRPTWKIANSGRSSSPFNSINEMSVDYYYYGKNKTVTTKNQLTLRTGPNWTEETRSR
ncbi:Extracellular_nuclease [Hexamita inflata]|uniref:Extracellular nuclease n=1 Tax=Hexamita inflata TaxID=28002 RepID=A0AA86QYJ8_9EUKA|nr:Extracellular nuclease [Hexamita inflata]